MSSHSPSGPVWRRVVAGLLLVSGLLTFGYAALAYYVATQLVYAPPSPAQHTPGAFGLSYRDVTFPAREDHVQISGWFIPGVLPNGALTAQRTIIVVHGVRTNREDPGAGVLDLSIEFVLHGFAVLAFDMRGMGTSAPAPLSLGYFEQRDVLGAVDFLRTGTPPYPELGRPRAIGGWGLSMGAATLLLAAAREPAIQAVVSDCAFSRALADIERELPMMSGLPPAITPGTLLAARALYGMDFYAVRPVDVVARIAPRPVFFIHGTADQRTPFAMMDELARAASAAPNAHVQSWAVTGARHAQSFHVARDEYVNRVVAFFTAALGPDTSAS
jgi:fermentation-respiration switch protein FrsA (DUF1100 family)